MERKREPLGTVRAAGIAGVVFAVLMAVAIVLLRTALPGGAEGHHITVDAAQRRTVQTALGLLPYAGIAFLWFMGALREQVGEAEDRFMATVFLGSGVIFVATLFGCAAAAVTVLDEDQQNAPFGRNFAYTLLTTYSMRMAAVFIITTSTIGRRLGVLPRPLVLLGFATGLTLLLAGTSLPWSELVFPAWALIVSLDILRGGRASTPRRRPAST
ncbi:hypothetical protein ABZ490_20520 [Streptomyces sp. NPDC005811]|uniref:hypothetical protein n=1 Tax=Streptomyces sp. NPDC005811 TaxID=3154565 RepID=UPI0033CAC6E2